MGATGQQSESQTQEGNARTRLLAMLGVGEEDVAMLPQVIEQKDKAYQKELTAKDERIAALEAQLQKLQQPKEGVPPV
eukprot:COSAG05_NODE_1822_length_4012_cov_18.291592_1_plen_78_part_00